MALVSKDLCGTSGVVLPWATWGSIGTQIEASSWSILGVHEGHLAPGAARKVDSVTLVCKDLCGPVGVLLPSAVWGYIGTHIEASSWSILGVYGVIWHLGPLER